MMQHPLQSCRIQDQSADSGLKLYHHRHLESIDSYFRFANPSNKKLMNRRQLDPQAFSGLGHKITNLN